MKTISIYAPWPAGNLMTEINSGQKISQLWGAGHPAAACCVDHSKVRYHSAFCRVEVFSSIWIQLSGKWEPASWKYWVILVIEGCNRLRRCEDWCSLPPSSPHLPPLSLLCEHFKNVPSEHPSLSCLKKTRRDCRHGFFLTWFFLGGEISKVVFLFLRHLIFPSCWTLPKNPTTLLIYSVLFHALSEQIIPSHKLAVSDHLSARVAQGAGQAGVGWLSAGPSKQGRVTAWRSHWSSCQVGADVSDVKDEHVLRITTGLQPPVKVHNAGNKGLEKGIDHQRFQLPLYWCRAAAERKGHTVWRRPYPWHAPLGSSPKKTTSGRWAGCSLRWAKEAVMEGSCSQ